MYDSRERKVFESHCFFLSIFSYKCLPFVQTSTITQTLKLATGGLAGMETYDYIADNIWWSIFLEKTEITSTLMYGVF